MTTFQRLAQTSTAQGRASHIQPVAFVHAPKSGTTFFNVLYNHPGICPRVPKGLAISQPGEWKTLLMYHPRFFCANGWSESFTVGHPSVILVFHHASGKRTRAIL